MQKILIISDTHGMIHSTIEIIKKLDRIDAIVHAGDYVRDAQKIQSYFPKIPVYSVSGNGDSFSSAPLDMDCNICSKHFFITHGHKYNVKSERLSDYKSLVEKGKTISADVVVFGHTHIPYIGYCGNMTIINPGSATFSNTYAICEIDGSKIRTSIVDI